MTDSDDQGLQRYASAIGDVMAYVANEAVLLARMEEYFSPQPAKLWEKNEESDLHAKLYKAEKQMGGPGSGVLIGQNDPPPPIDSYPSAILQEMLSAFRRSRKSVCRAHMFMIGATAQAEHPGFLETSTGGEISKSLIVMSERAFWEHAETAYIRLASYWDRVGQVLDFAFFGIRHFERDGFSAVMDRLHSNVARMYEHFDTSASWKALLQYKRSQNDSGLGWLLRRRNITVHSLHLRPADSQTDDVDFKPMYNHLEEKLKSKLVPRSPENEVKLLHVHLEKAASLFRDVLEVIDQSDLMRRDR